jgi:diguanylate cyclase (GGDEF)-like protein
MLFLITSIFSFVSIQQMRGNARVVNYTGIVRGATQKLVKEELMCYPDDALINRLDIIVAELITGEGPNNLIVLHDEVYLSQLMKLRQMWSGLKKLIKQVRGGNGREELYSASQDYFDLANEIVSLAEIYSEKQVRRSNIILFVVDSIFIGFIVFSLIYFIRSLAIKKRADALGKIAYVDPLTQIDNRASCELKIKSLQTYSYGEVSALMFDMNNLKLVNDFLGHKGGDRIIMDFARILKNELPPDGFIGRYGGDEFLGFLMSGSEAEVESYLSRIKARIASYNTLYTSEIQKISFAAGFASGDPQSIPVDYLINEADKRMYANKHLMKKK